MNLNSIPTPVTQLWLKRDGNHSIENTSLFPYYLGKYKWHRFFSACIALIVVACSAYGFIRIIPDIVQEGEGVFGIAIYATLLLLTDIIIWYGFSYLIRPAEYAASKRYHDEMKALVKICGHPEDRNSVFRNACLNSDRPTGSGKSKEFHVDLFQRLYTNILTDRAADMMVAEIDEPNRKKRIGITVRYMQAIDAGRCISFTDMFNSWTKFKEIAQPQVANKLAEKRARAEEHAKRMRIVAGNI